MLIESELSRIAAKTPHAGVAITYLPKQKRCYVMLRSFPIFWVQLPPLYPAWSRVAGLGQMPDQGVNFITPVFGYLLQGQ